MAHHPRSLTASGLAPLAAPPDWPEALLIAAILAVAPEGLGVHVRLPPGPEREGWLSLLRRLLPAPCPLRRCPPGIDDARLLGGLDLAATLASGRRVVGSGLLAGCDGGVLVLSMAERAPVELAARLGQALETGELVLERDAVAAVLPTRFALVALDDGRDDEPPPPAILLDRLAFTLAPVAAEDRGSVSGALVSGNDAVAVPEGLADLLDQAHDRLGRVSVPDAVAEALCRTALLAGIGSLRAPLLALRVAGIVAALSGHERVEDADAALAARLVLAPRAQRLPEEASDASASDEAGAVDGGEPSRADPTGSDSRPPPDPDANPDAGRDAGPGRDTAGTGAQDDAGPGADTAETVLRAVQAALSPDLLQPMRAGSSRTPPPAARAGGGGRTEASRPARKARPSRGRPIGTEPGDPSRGRLDVLATLRAALPWQALRGAAPAGPGVQPRLRVRREDFRIRRFAPRLQLVTIFLLDASGSSARARLAEAKGCVSILLADCYARRDRVALLAVRQRDATLVLPPTGSVVRARRALDQLPGGGGTPLAAGLDAARLLAERVRRDGAVPLLVLLTDGRANVARDGSPGRDRATQDALAAGRQLRALGLPSLLVDISPRARGGAGLEAVALAASLGARCLALPSNNAALLAREAADLGARHRPSR